MAYHLLSAALGSLSSRTEGAQAFATSLGHALRGFVDMGQFHQLGRSASEARPLWESRIWDAMAEAAANDLNPIGRCFLAATSLAGVLAVHRSVHQLTRLTVKTEFVVLGGVMTMRRRLDEGVVEDPTACKDAHLAAIDIILSRLPANAAAMRAGQAVPGSLFASKVSDIAERSGLGYSAAREAALAFEGDSRLQVADVAMQLGCQARTLQRELKATGITANQIRQASMLNAATSLLPSAITLTEIAHQSGYADQAHMTRAFVASCGLPPSLLRRAFA